MIKTGAWSWTDGTKFDFGELWDHRMSNASYCTAMKPSDGTWNIRDCFLTMPFVCISPATPQPCRGTR
uniref:C-type lectin domain-containing protein n=1 Tax=Panagrolaimus sp. PS1159 TaxID=55785 RepID=A0AC35GG81_9BILA